VTHNRKYAVARTAILLFVVLGCAAAQQVRSGNFAGRTVQADSTTARPVGVASVTLDPAQITGGASTSLTVNLTRPAPRSGFTVELKTSEPGVVLPPVTLVIPYGHKSAAATVRTTPVTASITASISAHSGTTVAGASLDISPEATSKFTVSLHPATLTIKPGDSGSTTVKTKIDTGFDDSLTLSALDVPAGVSIDFDPQVISAPGTGSSTASITVDSSAADATHTIPVVATGGGHSSRASLKLIVGSSSKGPGATFQGCWYESGGDQYQGVLVSVANPGTYGLNGTLYYGTTCNPNDWADQIGFGEPVNFGGFDWVFWFSAFANESDMSTQWTVGSETSACFSYENAPACP